MRSVSEAAHRRHLWWQQGVVYQIYPRSFQDSNGDGVGDLVGIEQRLDYLEWLGVDAVWLGPVFPSPMADFGYDVADYTAVHPLFGTLDDLDRLVAACHARGMKLLLDFVPNHTSIEHPWFVDSGSSRDSARRDWYVWRDAAADGGPPNNWLSVFGGSAWEFDPLTGQYYYHAFLKEQPDLNWRNPEVRAQMSNVLRFWLDRGIDGFRIDVLWHLIKDERLRDNPQNPDHRAGDNPYHRLLPVYSTDQPGVHDVAAAMRAVADEYDERVLVGEIYLPIERLVAYYGNDGRGVHLPFNFQLVTLPWKAREIDRAINEYEGALPRDGWPNWVLGNHDKARLATRVGAAQARVAAVLLLTLRGTPTLYYGDELGMTDVDIPEDRLQDPQGLRLGPNYSRDPCRTPMPWNASPGGAFTTGEPWLPLNRDIEQCNVETQRGDASSLLALYRRLLTLRRERPALAVGDYVPVPADGDAIAYQRVHESGDLLIALNLGGIPCRVAIGGRSGTVTLGTDDDRVGERIVGALELRGNEALVMSLGEARR
jgi:alpha-glucosidase